MRRGVRVLAPTGRVARATIPYCWIQARANRNVRLVCRLFLERYRHHLVDINGIVAFAFAEVGVTISEATRIRHR
jgi:hypothetical protein